MDVRLLTTDDARACNDFHNRLHHNERRLDQWQWDFVPGAFEIDQIPFAVVDDDGRIAGTQAFIPIRMINRDGVFWTAKSEETLLDPEYRGKRLFEHMYALLFEYAERHDLRYIWGFTPATKAFVRQGFQTPTVTEQLFYPFSGQAVSELVASRVMTGKPSFGDRVKLALYRAGGHLARMQSSFAFSAGYPRLAGAEKLESVSLRTLEAAPEEAGALCETFVRLYGGTTIYRDRDYLTWRIFENPYLKATMRAAYDEDELLGWVLYSVGADGMGYIVDCMVAFEEARSYTAEDVVMLLLGDATRAIKTTGALGIRGWRVNGHPFDQMVTAAAERLGYYHIKQGHTVVLRSGTVTPQAELNDSFESWYVSRIYTEGVAG